MSRSDELWAARAVREAEPPACAECGEPVPHVEHEDHGGFCLTCAALHGDAGAIHELAAGAADAELDEVTR